MITFKTLIYLFLVSFLLISTQQQASGLSFETDYDCFGSSTSLECPSDSLIVVTTILSKYSPSQCVSIQSVSFDSKGTPPLDHCVGVTRTSEDDIARTCNGKTSCIAMIKKRQHSMFFDGTNCTFESNMDKVIYKCLPNESVYFKAGLPSFEMCNYAQTPTVITEAKKGFISSPNYPNYYGNYRDCMVSIQVPKNHFLEIFQLRKSIEDISFIKQKAKDFFIIDGQVQHYGFSDVPSLVYSGGDRERVAIKFQSDFITTAILNSPKGFLLFFEITPPVTTTTESTTTTTTTTKETTTITATALPINQRQVNFMNQKLRKESESTADNEVFTIIAVLVGLVGVLIVVIFSLLFVFRKKQINHHERSKDEEYVVYDDKSVSSGNNYNEEYQNISIVSSMSSKKLNKKEKSHCNLAKSAPTASSMTNFNNRLKTFYSNLNKTFHLSNTTLISGKEANSSKEEINSSDCNKETLNLKENKETSLYNINEFDASDIKFEKDIPIDRLKLFRSSTRSLGASSVSFKKNNIELEQEQKENRLENTYVSNPMGGELVKNAGETNDNDEDDENGKLNIYEVNFENNFAYMKPSFTKSISSLASKKTNCENVERTTTPKNNHKNDENDYDGINIYQSIDDMNMGGQKHNNKKPSDEQQLITNETKSMTNQSLNESSYLNDDPTRSILGSNNKNETAADYIYSTPSNKRVLKSSSNTCLVIDSTTVKSNTGEEATSKLNEINNQNSSVLHLLNDEELNETNA